MNRKWGVLICYTQAACFPSSPKKMMSHALSLRPDPPLIQPRTRIHPQTPRQGVEQQQGHPRFTPSTEEANAREALLARDPAALDRLVRDQCQWIYGAILRLVHDSDEARSLVQETFLQAFRSLDAFRGHAKVSTWLYGIALNVTRTHLRKKVQHRRILSERDIDWAQPQFTWKGTHTKHNPAWDPEMVVEKGDRARKVRNAIDRLPERYREVLVMRDLEELSTAEVAEVLSISEGNVRVRLHRARNALRTLLAPLFAPA